MKNTPKPAIVTITSLVAITLACFLIYGQILKHGFVWDDLSLIVHSDALRSWNRLGDFFLYPQWYLVRNGTLLYFRPFFPLFVLIVSTLSGLNAFGYHLGSLILHSLTAWLFFQWLKKLGFQPAIGTIITLFFILHPVLVESVAWISCASILLGTFFSLLTLHLSNSLEESKNEALQLFWIGTTLACAVFSYPTAYTLPVLVISIHFLNLETKKKSKHTLVMELLVFTLVIGVALIMRINSYNLMGRADLLPHPDIYIMNIVPTGESLEWIIRPINVLTRYIELLIIPLNLVPDAYFKSTEWSIIGLAAFAFFSLTSIALYRETKKQYLFLALSLIVIPLLPILNILPTGGQFADRYLYLPCAGFAIWLGLLLNSIAHKFKDKTKLSFFSLLLILSFPILLTYTVRTVDQTRIWKDELTFWRHVSHRSPHKANTHSEYASALARDGQLEAAKIRLEHAVRVSPDYIWPQIKLADLYRDLGYVEKEAKVRARIKQIQSAG